MSFDGIVVNSLSRELKKTLGNSKIDKVYQPEKDEICLKIRARQESYKLVISASASNPRTYLADMYEKTNPKKAPVFCMTLRKHIQGGIITDIEQVDFERIIKISVESYDELKEKTLKYLFVEIMGKHSNIILVSHSGKIIDSIKRIPLSVSRLRQVLPGAEYELPPSQNKLNPLKKISVEEFKTLLKEDDNIVKSLYSNILGISPLVAKEVCFRSGVSVDSKINEISLSKFNEIMSIVEGIFDDLKNDIDYPNMIIDTKKDKIVEFSSIELKQYQDMSDIKDDSISAIIEQYYLKKDIKDRLNQKSSSMKKSISLRLDRVNNKIKKQLKELRESENAHVYKTKGELITSYIYMIKKGMESVEVLNFYDENNPIMIKLNPNLSPSENAQKYFKKYNKLKNANEELTKLLIINKEESEYLDNILLSIDNSENSQELKEIREELVREGYLKSRNMPKKNNKPKTVIMKYLSSNGNTIMVGRNNKQNDYLTLKMADNDDYWFHTKDIPGSHVLLKCAGKQVNDEEIKEAATLAAYYSKAKMSSNVPIDYTRKKNVKKPSGAKPGMVIYEKNKTVYVTPSDEEKAKIKKIED
ncbi:Rqc2 family fibronectin-binding protein [Peptostreptococcus faecalis]|uniref:Rqc2 family fibronectin-binding protein n=1 Tax=Peptostreptococcus faecalis TaxID=2045015 RepID=UPI000C797A22|nr:NFACT RNA binding domain-containing protein [Peptostreptococcus faecalis]